MDASGSIITGPSTLSCSASAPAPAKTPTKAPAPGMTHTMGSSQSEVIELIHSLLSACMHSSSELGAYGTDELSYSACGFGLSLCKEHPLACSVLGPVWGC